MLLITESPTPETAAAAEVSLPSPGADEPDYSFSPQDDEFISDHLSNYEDANEREFSTMLVVPWIHAAMQCPFVLLLLYILLVIIFVAYNFCC